MGNAMDGVLDATRQLIREHGWSVMYVFDNDGSNPAFHYTVGLAAFGHPELITYALPQDVGHTILNDLAQRLVDGREPYANGEILDDVAVGYDVAIVDCIERAPAFLAEELAEELAPGQPYRVQQLVTPDRDNHLPWEVEYSGHLLPIHGAP